jgi:hypothetical protein
VSAEPGSPFRSAYRGFLKGHFSTSHRDTDLQMTMSISALLPRTHDFTLASCVDDLDG